jgi:hypothetical protein
MACPACPVIPHDEIEQGRGTDDGHLGQLDVKPDAPLLEPCHDTAGGVEAKPLPR